MRSEINLRAGRNLITIMIKRKILYIFNRVLSHFNLKMDFIPFRIPAEKKTEWLKTLERIERETDWRVEKFEVDMSRLPLDNKRDAIYSFAASQLSKLKPGNILDIGSHYEFTLGLLVHYPVTCVDIRERKSSIPNETVIICDAKKLNLPDNSFDAAISLCALQHFGLGRYGGEIDLAADRKTVKEITRVLRPGGYFIVDLPIIRGKETVVFSSHKVYNYEKIRELCEGLELVEERFYRPEQDFIKRDEITEKYDVPDLYLGCFKKLN